MPENRVIVQIYVGVEHGTVAERFFVKGPANQIGAGVRAGSMSGGAGDGYSGSTGGDGGYDWCRSRVEC